MTKIIAIIDGTMSRLDYGLATHAGNAFKLCLKLPPTTRKIFYDPGVQGEGLRKWLQVASGAGLNLSIAKIYEKISRHYQPGDEIFLFGYSRGAYAVRLIAGMIYRMGLLQKEHANLQNAGHVLRAYNELHYSQPYVDPNLLPKAAFLQDVEISFLGVWDTVKALGIPLPFMHRLTPMKVEYKDLEVPANVRIARHALAKDEHRWMFEPELWASAAPQSDMRQELFAGDHAVIGGQIERNQEVRLLANFSFHWMLDEAEKAGLALPSNWREAYPTDPCAPASDRVWYDYLWLRKSREFTPPEYFHEHNSVKARRRCSKFELDMIKAPSARINARNFRDRSSN